MRDFSTFLTIFLFSFIAWVLVLSGLYFFRNTSRLWLVILHYLLDIIIFGIVFGAYFRSLQHLSPFATMALVMISLFLIEFVWWRFLYSGPFLFLNFVDWIVPAFLIASTVYFVGVLIAQ